jgi:hypothetical protein
MGKTSKRYADYILWVIGALMLASALMGYKVFFNLRHIHPFKNQAIVIIYFSSAVIGFIGLLFFRIWGFIASYINVLTATIFLSTPVIPFLLKFLRRGHSSSTMAVSVINLLMLILIGYLHGRKAR